MTTQYQTFGVQFKGGLISRLSPLAQGTEAIGSATFLQNYEPTKFGGYKKILGYTKYDTNTVPGTGPILGIRVISASEALAVRSDGANTKMYYSAGTGWTLKGTGSLNGGKARFSSVVVGSTKYTVIVDGANYPAIFEDSGNTVTYLASPSDVQGAGYIISYKTAMFYAKGTDLIFTAPNSYSDFSAANGSGIITLEAPITGLAVFRDQLFVFTRNSVKRLSGSTIADFEVNPVTDKIGCINGDTIQEIGGDIMYAAPDGLRLLSATDRIGDFGLDVASDTIAKDANTFLNSTDTFSSIVLREKAQYRVFAYNLSEQSHAAAGLLTTKFSSQGAETLAWAKTKGIKAYCADSQYTETNQEVVLFAHDDGYVYELETASSFDGQSIEAIYESPYMPITDPQTRKTIYKLALYVEPTGQMDLSVALKFDFGTTTNTGLIQPPTQSIGGSGTSVFLYGSTGSTYGTSTYGGELDRVYNLNTIGSGKTVAIRIADDSSNPTHTLDTAVLEFRQNDRQ